MIEALLSLSLSCSDARQIVSRMMKLDYMTYQEKVEVARESEGYKSVSYNGLIGLLIEVVKEQQKQIDELKNK